MFPAFLKRLDKHLLLNHPLLWASRVHYVAFFAAVSAVLIMLRVFLLPVHLGDLPDVELGFALIFIELAPKNWTVS